MRGKIWKRVTKNQVEAAMLSRRLIIIKSILYPLEMFYLRMSKRHGYQFMSDTWVIDGIRYPSQTFRTLSSSGGEAFRVKRNGEVLTLEPLDESEHKS